MEGDAALNLACTEEDAALGTEVVESHLTDEKPHNAGPPRNRFRNPNRFLKPMPKQKVDEWLVLPAPVTKLPPPGDWHGAPRSSNRWNITGAPKAARPIGGTSPGHIAAKAPPEPTAILHRPPPPPKPAGIVNYEVAGIVHV